MPADEVTHAVADVDAPRGRTGPRHAAPRKPLFTRLHVPAGKAIALAAMPTAFLMGMGFTPRLALADEQPASRSLPADEQPAPLSLPADEQPASLSLPADEYAEQFKECVAALDAEAGKGASATPSPSASASAGESAEPAEPSPSAPSGAGSPDGPAAPGQDSSPDSGSDDGASRRPSPSSSVPVAQRDGEAGPATPVPSASESDQGVLGSIVDAITGVVEGVTGRGAEASASPTPSPSASPSAGTDADEASGALGDSDGSGGDSDGSGGEDVSGSVRDAAGNVTDAVDDVRDEVADEVAEPAGPTDGATATPSPSASSTTNPEDCPRATDAEGGVDNELAVADEPWRLEASSLLLKGADYRGIVEVRTAGGRTKKVLKYVISDGSDIGDLHQLVRDRRIGKTYHVQAAKGSLSTITDGVTVMYTESISGNLFGLIPITFSPENPPPLNIPLIYFTDVAVTQAAQFGGTLFIPGMHVFTTD
ncbi:hypothetical protein [Streptomyces cinereospinus]|uniref:Membrane-bound hydrophilic protein n=1 Tax=Streptomyces cinereospinus TaxID=285561 RepID=A0ABV5N3F7_9ACTN